MTHTCGKWSNACRAMFRLLKPGRYAVLVVGDPVYESVLYPVAQSLSEISSHIGFETVCTVERPIHNTKRSFVAAGRRATSENLVVLRKTSPLRLSTLFRPPPYKLWSYEKTLREREIEAVLGVPPTVNGEGHLSAAIDPSFAYEVSPAGLYSWRYNGRSLHRTHLAGHSREWSSKAALCTQGPEVRHPWFALVQRQILPTAREGSHELVQAPRRRPSVLIRSVAAGPPCLKVTSMAIAPSDVTLTP